VNKINFGFLTLARSQHSKAISHVMGDSSTPRQSRKHLSDIDIGKILKLVKALLPQRKITSHMKCSQKTDQHTLATYLFEIFQGCNPWREYQFKTIEYEDRYIERALKQNSSVPLRDITDIYRFANL
jgi:hypothetical protein